MTSSVVNNVIYVIGGYTYISSNTTEAYFLSNNSWVTLNPMPTARYDLTSNVVNNVIYAIGGYNTGGSLNTTEAYGILPTTTTTIATKSTSVIPTSTGSIQESSTSVPSSSTTTMLQNQQSK